MQRTAAAVVQLSGERHKISFTGSQRIRDLLQEAQELRRHRYPAGGLEPLFERALELLVAEEKKRRFAHTPKPRARSARTSRKRSRHIPHPVQRQVWTRDAGQCRFVSVDGQRQPHNALYAERDYGRAYIERRIEHRSPGSGARMIRRSSRSNSTGSNLKPPNGGLDCADPGGRTPSSPEICDESRDMDGAGDVKLVGR